MNWKALMASNLNCFENKGLLKATASHVYWVCGNISETVLDEVVVTTDHKKEVIYGQLNSGNSDDLEWPDSCTALDKISQCVERALCNIMRL